MTLEKAIELMQTDIADIDYNYPSDLSDAMKLGVEALKRVKNERVLSYPLIYHFLPGETTDA